MMGVETVLLCKMCPAVVIFYCWLGKIQEESLKRQGKITSVVALFFFLTTTVNKKNLRIRTMYTSSEINLLLSLSQFISTFITPHCCHQFIFTFSN
jgi:amino acid permease